MNQEIQGPRELESSLKLNKQAYLTSLADQTDRRSQEMPSQKSQQLRVQFLEDAAINPSPTSDEIYKEHREFLQNYKRQRQREREALTSQHQKAYQTEHNQRRRSASVADDGGPSRESQALVMQRLQGIQDKVSQEIASQRFQNDRPTFKLFAEVVENKNDIQRVSKERRFLRSQQSKHYEYHEPAMPARSKLPAGLRVRTEGILDEAQLGRNARQFIERVQKEQERLLGKHLLRRKVEEGRRVAEEGLEGRRAVEENDHKREERRLKAETNLMLMKEKIKLAKIVHRQPEGEGNIKLKEIRYSLHGGKTSETEVKQRPQFTRQEGSKITVDRRDRLKESEFNIKDRIAIRKHKNIRPTDYSQVEQEFKQNRIKTEQQEVTVRDGAQSAELPSHEDGLSQGEGLLPSNQLQNQFISFTQYQSSEERASKFKRQHNDLQSSLES